MRVLVVGAGGVGAAIARGAAESEVLEHVVVADVDVSRAATAVERCADARFVARGLDASKTGAITELARRERADVVLNACDPRLNPSIFAAAFDAGCHYIDMAMTLSEPDAVNLTVPYEWFERSGQSSNVSLWRPAAAPSNWPISAHNRCNGEQKEG